ncbi:MAG: hypothetical protein ACFFF9_09845 [Candidatus Thorarchaeota archaeon]
MNLSGYYTAIIRITLMDAIVLGAGAGLLVAAYLGMKARQRNITFRNLFKSYGIAGAILGTLTGYICMNIVGYFVAFSGSPFHGLSGVDLIEWNNFTSSIFTQYQFHAIGFALFGSLLGNGWGYSIRPEETSRSGNTFATLGIFGLLGGLSLMIMPTVLYSSPNILTLLNVLVLLCYANALLYSEKVFIFSPQPDDSGGEQIIE